MDAATLHCPACGAAAPAGASSCPFCRARLATVACPSCFGLVFVGSRHCAHCGARTQAPAAREDRELSCPRGCGALRRMTLGGAELHECPRCAGLWVDEPTFDRLCAERERDAGVRAAPREDARVRVPVERVRYARCPSCARTMNRVNFARSSGVVVDECRGHGVWFDEDELRRVVEFVRSGGLDRARTRERAALAEERRLLQLRQTLASRAPAHPAPGDRTGEPSASGLLAAFAALLTG